MCLGSSHILQLALLRAHCYACGRGSDAGLRCACFLCSFTNQQQCLLRGVQPDMQSCHLVASPGPYPLTMMARTAFKHPLLGSRVALLYARPGMQAGS